jgi:hypothetical protein
MGGQPVSASRRLLAELGVIALRGPPLGELLNEAFGLAAEGLEAELCKILEFIPSENRLLMRVGAPYGRHAGDPAAVSYSGDVTVLAQWRLQGPLAAAVIAVLYFNCILACGVAWSRYRAIR